MTREEIIYAIYRYGACHNTSCLDAGKKCYECAEKELKEYEDKIRQERS